MVGFTQIIFLRISSDYREPLIHDLEVDSPLKTPAATCDAQRSYKVSHPWMLDSPTSVVHIPKSSTPI